MNWSYGTGLALHWATAVTLVPTMILGPFAAGAGLLCLRLDKVRRILVGTVTVALCCCALALVGLPAPVGLPGFPLDNHHLNLLMLLIEAGMGLYVVYVGCGRGMR